MPESATRHMRGAKPQSAHVSTDDDVPESHSAPPTHELHELLAAMAAMRDGDFDVQLPRHWEGIAGRLAETFNQITSHNRRLAHGLSRVGEKVGRDGQTRQRLAPADRQGCWAIMEESVNGLIDDLVRPVETMTEAIAGIAKGDLTRSVPLEADGRPLRGEFLRSATIVNRMAEQMGEFSSEVTRVALEVGTAGKLGGQATVKGVSGVWKDLTHSVNQMASNLTSQVLANQTLSAANTELQLEKARVLQTLNESLRVANSELAERNLQLQLQVGERESAEARLLRLDRHKDEFLATLAHELRNPLASLSNAVNVLQLSAPDSVDTLYATMQRQLGLLVHLID
ncbi:MAG TPA: histidine kinase dimerization/phospho-acceptor domain-containing protein, partial [Lysobacter sp.]